LSQVLVFAHLHFWRVLPSLNAAFTAVAAIETISDSDVGIPGPLSSCSGVSSIRSLAASDASTASFSAADILSPEDATLAQAIFLEDSSRGDEATWFLTAALRRAGPVDSLSVKFMRFR
jgi:hypothetical protein